LQAETLRATAKRKALELPTPYIYGKKLYWRRSELDAWVEQRRREPRAVLVEGGRGGGPAADHAEE
jgi:hypothetical protein